MVRLLVNLLFDLLDDNACVGAVASRGGGAAVAGLVVAAHGGGFATRSGAAAVSGGAAVALKLDLFISKPSTS